MVFFCRFVILKRRVFDSIEAPTADHSRFVFFIFGILVKLENKYITCIYK